MLISLYDQDRTRSFNVVGNAAVLLRALIVNNEVTETEQVRSALYSLKAQCPPIQIETHCREGGPRRLHLESVIDALDYFAA